MDPKCGTLQQVAAAVAACRFYTTSSCKLAVIPKDCCPIQRSDHLAVTQLIGHPLLLPIFLTNILHNMPFVSKGAIQLFVFDHDLGVIYGVMILI